VRGRLAEAALELLLVGSRLSGVVIPARLIDLGLEDYETTRQRQLDLVGARQRGEVPDTLLLVEHPHVFTLGRAQKAKANLLATGDVPVVEIERGGDVTYHGPGQLVAYPILQLGEGERDLHKFLRGLEEAMIRALADVGVAGAGRRAGATGVWLAEARKIASIGIACRKWVTFHGLALNVATDLSYFGVGGGGAGHRGGRREGGAGGAPGRGIRARLRAGLKSWPPRPSLERRRWGCSRGRAGS
jgi:lipoyl(octanoyl) transferase